MPLDTLRAANKAVGIKQATRAIERDQAIVVFLAGDAEPRVISPLRELCARKNIPVQDVPTMTELGKASGIAVGSAAVAVIR